MDRSELTGGYIFDIQGFSVHDGPGCRTLIFFKGCPLSCPWCSNPEGIHPYPEPLWNQNRCTFDRLCVEACPYHAITISRDRLTFDRKKCSRCTTCECAKSCCTSALSIGGYYISTGKLLEIIRRDRQYWGPDGGITLSGGEPFMQPRFAYEILKQCYDAYIHTAAETCGNYPWENIAGSLPCLDWIFYDLKHVAKSTSQILDNAMQLAKVFRGRLIFRLPLISGINDSRENLNATAEFLLSTGRKEINILPGHHLGREKHALVGRTYYTSDFRSPSREELLSAQELFESSGIRCYPGNETPF